MKLIVVGAGASGITAAINYKRHHLNDEILVIERLDKPLKKILATGNGKCNLGNANINFSLFNNPDFAKEVISNYNYKNFFSSVSIETKLYDGLAYPISESATSVRNALLNECNKLGIQINVDEKLIDYNDKNVFTDKKTYAYDKLILAGGLKSSPKLGSDGSVLEILIKHGYKVLKPLPGLSPLYTKEKTKEIDGVRCKANVKVYSENKLIFDEFGEVLFKDHGLSGIVIFNAMSAISRKKGCNISIELDLLPDFDNNYLKEYLSSHSLEEFLQAFINPKISTYLKNRYHSNKEIFEAVKSLKFIFDKSYGYDFSQVTVGGIEVNQIDDNFMSKLEKNVYIVGELLNIDGPCGGYNLTWAFASALKVK